MPVDTEHAPLAGANERESSCRSVNCRQKSCGTLLPVRSSSVPASVVKELVENAFDAGATGVRVAIQRGGLGAIRVTDDGGGIPAAELELAVTRHATSKLATADDLAHVATLGFRGEALASIGAVSHLEIVSRPPDVATGARLRMVGGEITDQGATGGPAGTTITVRNLFYNVPARAAFQKSATTEARHVITALGALALVRPDVALSLTNNGRDALQAPGTGDLLDAIAAVYGPEVAGRLVPLPALEERGRAVSGFTALPDEHRANRQYLAFLVNGRWVRSPFLAHAVAEAYRGDAAWRPASGRSDSARRATRGRGCQRPPDESRGATA